MAKRIIHECDLTKQEFNPDDEQVFTLTIAKKGRRAPMKYELSAAAAERVLAQLNGSVTLANNWSFGSKPGLKQDGITFEPASPQTHLEDFDSDERMISQKREELREAGVEETPTETVLETKRGNCPHFNKGRIQVTLQGGKRFVYRKCNKCNVNVPEQTADDRKQYMSGKPPTDVRITDR